MDRDEFMELVYETFADEPDNVLANGIIEAADAYVEHEKTQLFSEGTTKDAISRQAAIDECNKRGAEHIGYAIAHLPTVQPEPHEGHWIRTDCGLDVECKCSRCGYKDFVEPRDEYWFKRNYCPNCGARMKGAKHEAN